MSPQESLLAVSQFFAKPIYGACLLFSVLYVLIPKPKSLYQLFQRTLIWGVWISIAWSAHRFWGQVFLEKMAPYFSNTAHYEKFYIGFKVFLEPLSIFVPTFYFVGFFKKNGASEN